ncbi:hypothetical protein BJ742DRAFT_671741 [Cladochytrium replicatum]|nr:hypothetical protein BJ742DRAFT_671741 [Cladochytrium replicatum]
MRISASALSLAHLGRRNDRDLHVHSPHQLNSTPYISSGDIFSSTQYPHHAHHLRVSAQKSVLVFSGGTAFNSFVQMLQQITENVAYVLPVSDDGGSTSEIVKIVGGPGVGDIRSRLVRLAETKTSEAKAVHDLLTYRLAGDCSHAVAKNEWMDVLDGVHVLWGGISEPYRETIRAFLCHFHAELMRQSSARGVFDFRNGSIGNFFLTGCRLFFNSLEAAIFQFARMIRLPAQTEVIPVVVTSAHHPIVIAAELRDKSLLVGQCEISHPGVTEPSPRRVVEGLASIPEQKPISSTPSNLMFSKTEVHPLPSPIRRIFYINSERQEVFPRLNPLVIPSLSGLSGKKTIIYSIGSLYTSIIPCLIVPGIGHLLADAVQARFFMVKILLLNSTNDRETAGYTALDFILAITDALNYSCIAAGSTRGEQVDHLNAIERLRRVYSEPGKIQRPPLEHSEKSGEDRVADHQLLPHPPRAYITHLLFVEGGEIEADVPKIEAYGIRCVKLRGTMGELQSAGQKLFDGEELRKVLEPLMM